MTTTYTDIAKATGTAYTDVAKPAISSVISAAGEPIGLLLALTHGTTQTVDIDIWTDVAKASGTVYTDIAKAT